MRAERIAKRYARALLQTCQGDDDMDTICDELTRFARAFEASAELREVIRNPTLNADARGRAVNAVVTHLGLGASSAKLIRYLLERQRLRFISHIVSQFQRQIDTRAGRVRAQVTSATELTAEQSTRIEGALKRRSGAKEVLVETRIDPEIIGGLIARIDNIVLDGSVRNQIEQVRAHLLAS